jgi:hypothetical protein
MGVRSGLAPMNWRMTPRPPLVATVPDWGCRSPATIRSSVVLPAPFGPTRAAVFPSPTRKLTSSSSVRPSGSTWLTCATSTCPQLATPGPYPACPAGDNAISGYSQPLPRAARTASMRLREPVLPMAEDR